MDTHAKAVQASYLYAKSPTQARQYVSTNLPGYILHPTLSNNKGVYLYNPDTKHGITAFRGTLNPLQNPRQGIRDYLDDALIAAGINHFTQTPREHEAEIQFHRIQYAYPNYTHTLAGHSLGADTSYKLGVQNNIESHNFNMGESPLPGISTYNRTMAYFQQHNPIFKKTEIYHSDNYKGLGGIYKASDPISEGSKYLPGTHHTIKVNTRTDLDAHNLSNFIKKSENKNVSTNLKLILPENKHPEFYEMPNVRRSRSASERKKPHKKHLTIK